MKKILISLIGKPGSGKTTVGKYLEKNIGAKYLSYSDILKEVNPNPGLTGYTIDDRRKANELVRETSDTSSVLIVSWNPQPEIGFWFFNEIKTSFDTTYIFYLNISDEIALTRLMNRNRDVLVHDGASEKERLLNFNTKQLSLIENQKSETRIYEIDVNELTVNELALKIISITEISV